MHRASSPPDAFTALLLAGRRRTADPDPLGAGCDVPKALLDVAGQPMIAWVLQALRSVTGLRQVLVSADDPAPLEGIAPLADLRAEGRLAWIESAASPAASVLAVRERQAPGEPLLVTTADHPLLTSSMIEHFWNGARTAAGADVVVGVVTASTLARRFPGSRRTFIRLRGERITGANLFALLGDDASRAVAFWQRADRIRKRPWRLARLFGPGTLARFALGRLDLDQALARVSQVVGARVAAQRLPFPECALDVDRPADLERARRLLAARHAADRSPV